MTEASLRLHPTPSLRAVSVLLEGICVLSSPPPAQLAVEIQAELTLKAECLYPGDFFFFFLVNTNH